MTTRVHISIKVADISKSIAFYEGLFGAEVTKRRDDYANFRLDEPGIHLSMTVGAPGSTGPGSGVEHFGVELADMQELTAWLGRSRAAGLDVVEQEQAVCCYATGEKLWLTDPDGFVWEIWVRTGDAEQLSEAGCCTPAGEKSEGSCCAPSGVGAAAEKKGCC